MTSLPSISVTSSPSISVISSPWAMPLPWRHHRPSAIPSTARESWPSASPRPIHVRWVRDTLEVAAQVRVRRVTSTAAFQHLFAVLIGANYISNVIQASRSSLPRNWTTRTDSDGQLEGQLGRARTRAGLASAGLRRQGSGRAAAASGL